MLHDIETYNEIKVFGTRASTQAVTNKPNKIDSDMKIDKTTYKDKEENQIGMTADHSRRPDKVLFFADPLFCFLRADLHCTHWQATLTRPQTKACQRVQPC